MKTFVMDACALIAFLSDETGAQVVSDVLLKAADSKVLVTMNGNKIPRMIDYILTLIGFFGDFHIFA